MKKKDLELMTVSELKTLAGKLKVKLVAKMRKDEIVDSLVPAIRKKEKTDTSRRKVMASKLQEVKAKVLSKPKVSPPRISPQERVEESKFAITAPAEHHQPSLFHAETLPADYGRDYVRLMARDPYWAHSYWEVTTEAQDRARKLLKDSDARLTLRIYDATDEKGTGRAISLFDIEVFQRVGNWYIELGRPDRSFFVEIGLKAKDGRFHAISRSNTISTPRDRVSDLTDLEWMISEDEFHRLFALSGGHKVGLSSAEMAGLK